MEVESNINIIRKKDPDFAASYFNFEELRRMGIQHIGELSGKIWTDHNAHDPGITILEMLCYALLDLGYRTTLPIEEILAPPPNDQHQNNNFFTPAEILTSNPTTILDYRKILMDIDGVANAWLEVAHDQKLYLDCPEDRDESGAELPTGWDETEQLIALHCESGEYTVTLNGLYHVFIQLEREQPYCNTKKTPRRKREEIVAEVRDKLLQHRNLGEDFLDIRILHEEEVGVQAKIELSDSAEPEETYVAILSKLQQFFNPSIRFYTLGELLNKGRSIEEIFEGRPFTQESFGFIDTEELAQLQLPKEVHFSDVYDAILSIKGVESVRDLFIPSYLNGVRQMTFNSTDCNDFVHHYTVNCAPVFCVDLSDIRVFRDSSIYRLDQRKVDRLLKKAFGNKQKAKTTNPLLLDRPIPTGTYRPDLGKYFSIQNEFPLVYGIGQGHLSEDVSDSRKAQALQLKAYLLLFDQLLASYLSQLSHLRELFSMTPDSQRAPAHRRTYFAQRLESIPKVEKLLRFHDQANAAEVGDIMAFPVDKEAYVCASAIVKEDPRKALVVEMVEFGSKIEQRTLIEQFRREFEQGNDLRVDILEEECGYFFAVDILTLNYVLVGKKRYTSKAETKLAAESVIFLGMLASNYRLVNDLIQGQFSFEILFQQTDYLSFLHELQEDRDLYLRRRNAFLDHLLARFSETFTDYSLLVYQASEEQKVENKAQLLSQYDDLSRNRGRGFNYCGEPWNTDNISGLEKRVSTLSGIHDFQRTDLCNFEVANRRPEYLVQLIDFRGNIAFTSSRNFQHQLDANAASARMLNALANSQHYITRDNVAESRYQVLLSFEDGFAMHPQPHFLAADRDKKRLALSALFRTDALEEDVFEADYAFQLWLERAGQGLVKKSKAYFDSEWEAINEKDTFIRNINTQHTVSNLLAKSGQKLELIANPFQEHLYLDAAGLLPCFQLDPTRCRWALQDQSGSTLLLSANTFASPQEAQKAFTKVLEDYYQQLQFVADDQAEQPYFDLENQEGELLAKGQFSSLDDFHLNREAALDFFQRETEEGYYTKPFSRAYQWQLKDDSGQVLLSSSRLFRDKRKAQKGWRDLNSLITEDNNWTVTKKEYGKLKLTLRDANGLLLAETPIFNGRPEAIATERLSVIQEVFTNKKQVHFLRRETAYFFQVPNPADKKEGLIESYYLYPSKLEAYNGLKSLMEFANRKQNYFLTGDEANSNHSFSIQDRQKNFIAFHPQTYGEVKEREKAMTRVIKAIKNFHFPVQTPNECVYRVVDANERTWLRSENVFPDQESAQQNYYQLLHLALDPSNYHHHISKEGNQHFFKVSNVDGSLAASSPAYSDEVERETAMLALQHHIQEHRYDTEIRRAPNKYKFRFWWEGPNGELEPLCESIEGFRENQQTGENGKDIAKKAYLAFVQKMRQGKIQVVRSQEGDAYRLKFLEKKRALTESPTTYLLPAGETEDSRFADAKKLLKYVATSHQTKRGPASNSPLGVVQFPNPEGGKFVYRVIKKGLPLAFHPCVCLEKEETGNEEETIIHDLYKAALEGYDFLEICLGGDIVCKIDTKYHYVIRGKEDGLIYFISYQAFDTMESAITAFQNDYLDVIQYASCIDNYCLPEETGIVGQAFLGKKISLCDTPLQSTEHCALSELPLVIMPIDTQEYFNETARNGIAEVVRRFCSYPFRKLKVKSRDKRLMNDQWKFYFQLTGNNECGETGNCQVDWLSAHCYDSIEEASRNFQHFLYLLKVHGSYRTFLDEDGLLFERGQGRCPGVETAKNEYCPPLIEEKDTTTGENCCHYIGLQEVLAESTCHFEEAGDAWGRDRLISAYACDDILYIERIIREKLLEPGTCREIIINAFAGGTFEPATTERNNLFYLSLDFDDDFLKFESAQGFKTSREALLYFDKIRDLLLDSCDDPMSYRIYTDDNCKYRVAFGVDCEKGRQTTNLTNCLSSINSIPVTSFLRKKGIERFLELANQKEAFYPFSTYQDGELCFSFHIVEDQFKLARHPYLYHTAEERNALAASFCLCCIAACHDLVLVCQEEPDETGTDDTESGKKTYRYLIYCSEKTETGEEVSSNSCHQTPSSIQPGTSIWTTHQTFCGCEGAQINTDPEAIDVLLEIMAYARESRFYYHYNGLTYLCRIPFSREDTLVNEHHQNCLESGDILAFSAYLEIEDLVHLALHYPFVKKEDGYGFQLYCDDFPDSFPIDDFPCSICEEASDELGTGEETGLELPARNGAVVWESVNSYDDLGTAKCYYQLFCALIQHSNNIAPTGDEDCGPYSFEVLNPDAILATHPQCYKLKAELQQAIDRTQACINIEGFHLLEHILLRPGKGRKEGEKQEACTCLLPIDPDCDCELCIDRFENDPCAQPQSLALMTGESGFDPCAEEELCDIYIPGSDPYSFWVTVLLPNWAERFRQEDYRQAFQDLIRQEAPAHIGLKILWISPEEMCKFETIYRKWLRWLSKRGECYPTEVVCQLKTCLAELNYCPERLDLSTFRQRIVSAPEFPTAPFIFRDEASVEMANLFTIRRPTTEDCPDLGRRLGQSGREVRQEGSARDKKEEWEAAIGLTQATYLIQEFESRPGLESLIDPDLVAPNFQEILSQKEKRKRIRRRLSQYQDNIELGVSDTLKKGNIYKKVLDFFDNPGDLQLLEGTIQYVWQYGVKRKKTKKEKAPYLILVQNMIWNFLDLMVNEYPMEVRHEEALQNLFLKLKSALNLKQLRAGWNTDELKAWTNALVIDDYLALIK